MLAEARRNLARTQGELMRALAGRGPAPAGFDSARVALAAEILDARRRRALQDAWPELVEMLGERFAERYERFARSHSLPRYGGPVADGFAFACQLRDERTLPLSRAVRLRVIALALRHGESPDGFDPRRDSPGHPFEDTA